VDYVYTVTAKPNSNAFAAVQRFVPENGTLAIECIYFDDEVEKFEIFTDRAIDALLDAESGIISWTDEVKLAMQAYDEMNRRILDAVVAASKVVS